MENRKKVAVVGGGPGGYIAAIRAAQLGAEVTLIERGTLGGTCLNVGCIPTKSIIHSAELYSEIRDRGAQLGIESEGLRLNFARVMAQKDDTVKRLVGGVSGLMALNKIKVVKGEASFAEDGRLSVSKEDGSDVPADCDAIILAAGSKSFIPPIEGIGECSACMDSTGALSLKELPKTMIVIGAGVIGLEIACAYANFGTEITIIEAMDHALPMMDRDISNIAVRHLKQIGAKIYLGATVLSVSESDKGAIVTYRNDRQEILNCEAEKVLVAVGRRADTVSLRLEAAGIENRQGRIVVDSHMRTNRENIYAIGDCVFGHAMLAHTASRMGEVAAENIMGIESVYDETTCPSCVYMEPEAASVGLREDQLEKGTYKVGTFPMYANGKAMIMNGGEGMVKILADAENEVILGVHIAGPRAADLISEGAVAIRMGMTADQLIDTIHSHPTISETVREAALDLQGRALSMPPKRRK